MEQHTPETNHKPPHTRPDETEKKSPGALIGLIVLILVIAAGFIYILNTKDAPTEDLPIEPATPEEQPAPNQQPTQGQGGDISDIEQDLESANFDNLNTDLEE